MIIHRKTFGHKTLDKSSLRRAVESGGEIILFNFPLLMKQENLVHAVFSRHGGKSVANCSSLNTSYNTDDTEINVSQNLDLIRKTIHTDRLIFMNQVHGSDIVNIGEGWWKNNINEAMKADALITNIPGVALMVKQADCQAVILFDPVERVIANVHCGWRGNVSNIIGKVVSRMESDFRCQARNLIATIGPSLGPCCAEFISYREIFPDRFSEFVPEKNHFDLWDISRMQLIMAGLDEKRIEIAEVCTKCNTDFFYSYRAEKNTGRFATVIMLS